MQKKLSLLLLALCLLVGLFFLYTPQAKAAETDIQLKYDDRKDLAQLLNVTVETVQISNQNVTSYQVGSTQADPAVLVYEDGILYAVGTGTATLTVNDVAYKVTVDPAEISLFMYTGHSVGHGVCGTAKQSVVVEAGQAYSSYDPHSLDVTQVEGYGLGYGSSKRVGNEDAYAVGNGSAHIDAFSEDYDGTRGPGSGLAYRWNQLTGGKAWVINLAVGGSCLNEWQPGASGHSPDYTDFYYTAVSRYSYAQTIIANEIAAGHYTLGHMGILYYCGANNKNYSDWTQESIEEGYQVLWNGFKNDLAQDMDGDGEPDAPEFFGLVPYFTPTNLTSVGFDKPAAFYMSSSQDYPDILMASDAYRGWMTDLQTFPEITYTTQSVAVSVPEAVSYSDDTPNSIMAADGSHPNQVVYNAMGMDAAENICAWLTKRDETVTSFDLVHSDMTEVPENITVRTGEPYLLLPIAKPSYVANISYEVTGDARLGYPLAVVGTQPGTATLTVKQGDTVLRTVEFTVVQGHDTHCVCGGNLTSEHHSFDAGNTWVPLTKDITRYYPYAKSETETRVFYEVQVGGQADKVGNIRLQSNEGTVNAVITGGTIEMGTATTLYPCMILANNYVNLTAGGDAKIAELFIYDGYGLNVSDEIPLCEGADIVIDKENNGILAENVSGDVSQFFRFVSTDRAITYDAEAKTLVLSDVIKAKMTKYMNDLSGSVTSTGMTKENYAAIVAQCLAEYDRINPLNSVTVDGLDDKLQAYSRILSSMAVLVDYGAEHDITGYATTYNTALFADYDQFKSLYATLMQTGCEAAVAYAGKDNLNFAVKEIVIAYCLTHKYFDEATVAGWDTYLTQIQPTTDFYTHADDVSNRNAHLAIRSISDYLAANKHIMNYYADSTIGTDSYGNYDKYMVTMSSFLSIAYLFADDTIAETVTPAETGGYAVETSGYFNAVFATVGDYSIQILTDADDHYDSMGLGRIQKKGVYSSLGLSTPCTATPVYTTPTDVSLADMSLGAVWYYDGVRYSLAQMHGLSHKLEIVSETAEKVEFILTYQGAELAGVKAVQEHYMLTKDGLTVTTKLIGSQTEGMQYTVPLLANNGSAEPVRTVTDNGFTVTLNGQSYQVTSDPESVSCEDTRYFNRNGEYCMGILESTDDTVTVSFTLD